MGKEQKVLNRKSFMKGRWSRPEKQRFVSAFNRYGKDWLQVAKEVKTRRISQVRSHAQKYLRKREEGYCSEWDQLEETQKVEESQRKILNLDINVLNELNQIRINSVLPIGSVEKQQKKYEQKIQKKDRFVKREKSWEGKSKQGEEVSLRNIEVHKDTGIYDSLDKKKMGSETSVFLQILVKYEDHFKDGGTFLQLSALSSPKYQNS